jgi:hypothetical protein
VSKSNNRKQEEKQKKTNRVIDYRI